LEGGRETKREKERGREEEREERKKGEKDARTNCVFALSVFFWSHSNSGSARGL
jgi:hypothetical protein